jgi:hypothetical protein
MAHEDIREKAPHRLLWERYAALTTPHQSSIHQILAKEKTITYF